MDQDRLKQQQKDFLRDIDFISTTNEVRCNTGPGPIAAMNPQIIVQDTGTILPFEGGDLMEEREYILPNGDRYIVQSPVKAMSRPTVVQNLGQIGHSESSRQIVETIRYLPASERQGKHSGQFIRIDTEPQDDALFGPYDQVKFDHNVKEESDKPTSGVNNGIHFDDMKGEHSSHIESALENGKTAMMTMSSGNHAVSKSISYTDTLMSGQGNQLEDKVIETKLLPSSVSEILPKAKNVNCDLCSYTTNRKSHLNEHYRIIHLKEKVICDLCGKEFANINQHMRVVHKVLRSGILTKKECQECHKEFYDLTKHMAKAHNLKYVYDYDCNICNVKFKSKFILQRHMQRRHGDKSECGECGKKVSNLDVHIKKVHRNKKNGPQCCFMCQRTFRKLADLNRHTSYCKEKFEQSYLSNRQANDHLNNFTLDNNESDNLCPESISAKDVINQDCREYKDSEEKPNGYYAHHTSSIVENPHFSAEISSIPISYTNDTPYDKEDKKVK